MALRRFHALVMGLPPEAALWRRGRLWTQAHELAATGIERGEHWGSALVQMSGRVLKDGAKVPVITLSHPDRVTAGPEKKKPASFEDVARMFGGRG